MENCEQVESLIFRREKGKKIDYSSNEGFKEPTLAVSEQRKRRAEISKIFTEQQNRKPLQVHIQLCLARVPLSTPREILEGILQCLSYTKSFDETFRSTYCLMFSLKKKRKKRDLFVVLRILGK